jgi:hypothetical protein
MAVTVALVVIGLALIVVSIVYFTETAANLPSFFPGHQAGDTHHHTKHGLAALAVGLVAFIGAWMSLGTKKSSAN